VLHLVGWLVGWLVSWLVSWLVTSLGRYITEWEFMMSNQRLSVSFLCRGKCE
jgi:hypothetical protein